VWKPSLSPDEASLVLWRVGTTAVFEPAIWTLDLQRGLLTPFSFGKGLFASPIWSPNGSRIVFTDFLGGFYEKLVTVSGAEARLIWKGGGQPSDWSSDGRLILFTGGTLENTDVMALRMDGEPTPMPVVNTRFVEGNAKFSPDHKWIAYRSYKSGRSEVFIQPFDRGGDVQLSTNGGAQPRWSRDGREVFYVGLDGTLMAAPVQIAAGNVHATVGQPVGLFATHIGDVTNINGQQYDVSRDGKRFLVATVTEEAGAPIVIISNRQVNH
jgi:Tol biopolymer transport system component